MRRKYTRSFAVLAAATLMVAACGGDDDSTDATTPPDEEVTEPTEAPDEEVTEPTEAPDEEVTEPTEAPDEEVTEPSEETTPPTSAAPEESGEVEVDSIVFSGVSPNAGNWAIQIGVAEGIFEEYGLPTEMIFSASSPAALTALISGSVQFTSILYDAGINAHLQEPDVIYVAGGYDLFPQELWVTNDINSIEDLEGKTCGSTNPPGTGDHLYTQMIISGLSNGEMKLGENYQILQTGGQPAVIAAAFDSGQIQCQVTLPPNTNLLASLGDYKKLGDAAGLPEFDNYPFFGINSMRSWVEEHPNATQAFLRGYLASIAWLYDPANEERGIEILAENAGMEPEIAAASYEWVLKGGYPRAGIMDLEWIRHTIDIQQAYGSLVALSRDIAPDIIDNSYVEAAYASLPDEVRNGAGPCDEPDRPCSKP